MTTSAKPAAAVKPPKEVYFFLSHRVLLTDFDQNLSSVTSINMNNNNNNKTIKNHQQQQQQDQDQDQQQQLSWVVT